MGKLEASDWRAIREAEIVRVSDFMSREIILYNYPSPFILS